MFSTPSFDFYRMTTDVKYMMTRLCSFINSNAKYHGDKDTKITPEELKTEVDTYGDNVLLIVKCNSKNGTNSTGKPYKCILITNDELFIKNIPEFTSKNTPRFDVLACMVFNTMNLDIADGDPVTFIKQYIELDGGYLYHHHMDMRVHYFKVLVDGLLKYHNSTMVLYSSLRYNADQDDMYAGYPNYAYHKSSSIKYSDRPFNATSGYYISDDPVELPKEYNPELLEFIKYQNLAINTHPNSKMLRNTIPPFPTMKTPFHSITYRNKVIGYLSVMQVVDSSCRTRAVIDCILFKDHEDPEKLSVDMAKMLSSKHRVAMALKRWAKAKNITDVQYSTIVPIPTVGKVEKKDCINQIKHYRYSDIFGLTEYQYRYAMYLKLGVLHDITT